MPSSSSDIRLALPKGKLIAPTAALLDGIGLGFDGYSEGTRNYRMSSAHYPNVKAKLFQEKDIPVQVSVGNYDLGICGSDWIEELLAKYRHDNIIEVADLGYGRGRMQLVSSRRDDVSGVADLPRRQCYIVSEYPNLAEAQALKLRLREFYIFPIWGAAEAYLPENANLALVHSQASAPLSGELRSLRTLFETSAVLIANKESWRTKNMGWLLDRFSGRGLVPGSREAQPEEPPSASRTSEDEKARPADGLIWLALPDGHQQQPTQELLRQRGVEIAGYAEGSRRPTFPGAGIGVKVVRPQDMPWHVANGRFDLAVSGQDWLRDHLCRFPASPVVELADLGFGQVRIVAVLSQELPVTSMSELGSLMKTGRLSPLRVASEYVNVADRYLQDHHIAPYRLIPTWGASEAFLPEDADLLIDNTQTGKTLAQHNLRIIDTLFTSSACLIGNKDSLASAAKADRMKRIMDIFRRSA
ncbi:MAG: ATP phosphoribosyltransferase [Chloroflexota bacterium]